MASLMLTVLRMKNPDANYPENLGKPWLDSEENQLLDELKNGDGIQTIANAHKRTVKGINSRREFIAFKMYQRGSSIQEISDKTKLIEDHIKKIIDKPVSKKDTEIQNINVEIQNINKEIQNMKSEFVNMKEMFQQLNTSIEKLIGDKLKV